MTAVATPRPPRSLAEIRAIIFRVRNSGSAEHRAMRDPLRLASVRPRLVVHPEAGFVGALLPEAIVERQLAALGVETRDQHAMLQRAVARDRHPTSVG